MFIDFGAQLPKSPRPGGPDTARRNFDGAGYLGVGARIVGEQRPQHLSPARRQLVDELAQRRRGLGVDNALLGASREIGIASGATSMRSRVGLA